MTNVLSARDEIVESARSITAVLAAHAAESNALRQLPIQSVEAMRTAGMWRILTPRTYGGSEAGIRAQVESALELATADPSAAWVQAVSAAHAWMIGNFPIECQDEVFGSGPDPVLPGTLAAQGRATRTDDGWILRGRWQFGSGVDHGDWLLIGAIADHLPESTDRALHVIVPKSDVIVDDTWFTLGLRGSGSKDVVAEDVVVPAHRSIPTRTLFDGHSPYGERHATHANRLPVLVCLPTIVTGVMVGLAQGMLDRFLEATAGRRDTYTGRPKTESVGIQLRVAESAAEIASAAALARAAADRCDLVGTTGERLTLEERAELKFHGSYVLELCRRAIDRLFATAGAHAIYEGNELLSRYRDINTACHHAVADFDSNAEMYGRVRLGLEPGTPLV